MKKTNIKKITFLLTSILTINSIIPGNYVMATENKINNINIESESSVDTDSNLDESSSNVEEINIKDIEKDTEQFETESSDETKNAESCTTEETTEEFETGIKKDDESKFYSDKTEITEEETDENTTVSEQDNNEEEYLITFYILDKNGIDYKEYQQIRTENKKIKSYPDCPEIEGAKFKEWRLIEDDTDYDLPEEYKKDCDIYAMYDFDIETLSLINLSNDFATAQFDSQTKTLTVLSFNPQTIELSDMAPIINGVKCNKSIYPWANIDFLSLEFDDSITSIGYAAFESKEIKYLDLNPNIKIISGYAFANSKIAKMPQLCYIERLGDYAFYNVSLFNTGKRIRTINRSMSSNCIDCSNMITIGDDAFNSNTTGMYDEIEKVIFSDKLQSIGDYAFYCVGRDSDWSGPTNLYSCSSVGNYAFANSGISSFIATNLTNIGNGAFYNTECLCEITLPDTEIILGKDAFYLDGILHYGSPKELKVHSNSPSLSKEYFETQKRITEWNIVTNSKLTYIGQPLQNGMLINSQDFVLTYTPVLYKYNEYKATTLPQVTITNFLDYKNGYPENATFIYLKLDGNYVHKYTPHGFSYDDRIWEFEENIDTTFEMNTTKDSMKVEVYFTGNKQSAEWEISLPREASFVSTTVPRLTKTIINKKLEKITAEYVGPNIYIDKYADKNNIIVTGTYLTTYSDNSTLTEDVDISVDDCTITLPTTVKGRNTIPVEYQGKAAECYYTGIEPTETKRELLKIKATYNGPKIYVDKYVNKKDISVIGTYRITYSDSSLKEKDESISIDDCTVSLPKTVKGQNTVPVSYQNKDTTCNYEGIEIVEINRELIKISAIYTGPDIYEHKYADKNDITVTGTYRIMYSDNTINTIETNILVNDCTITLPKTIKGSNTIPVEYHGKETSCTYKGIGLSIVKKELESIKVTYNGPDVWEGEKPIEQDFSVIGIYNITMNDGTSYKQNESIKFTDCTYTIPFAVIGTNRFPVTYESKQDDAIFNGKEIKIIETKLAKLDSIYTGPDIYVDNKPDRKDITIIAYYKETKNNGDIETIQKNIDIDDCKYTIPVAIKGENIIPIEYDGMNSECTFHGIIAAEISRILDSISAKYTGNTIIIGNKADINDFIVYANYIVKYADNHIETIQKRIESKNCVFTDLTATKTPETTANIQFTDMEVTKETNCNYPTKEKGKGQETKPSPDPEPTPSPTPVPKPDPIPVPEPIPEPVPIPTPSPDPIPIPVTPIVPPEPVKNIGSNEQIKEVPISDIQGTKVLPYMPDSIKDEKLEQEPKPEITHVQEKHEQIVEYHCVHPLIIICLMIIFILFVLVYIIVKHIIEKDDNENKDTTR